MKAVNHYLVVEKVKGEPKNIGGLIMTDALLDDENRYIRAKVVSTGNLVEGIKENDIIYYDKHNGHGIQYKDKLYHVIKIHDVVLLD
tara:strand:+ start:41 stop:301 length:261 start_codon:yes stop_codon:yes gene_type:complete